MPDQNKLKILLLADCLPNSSDPDPYFHSRNIFVAKQLEAQVKHADIVYPMPVADIPLSAKAYYRLRRIKQHFPVPQQGKIAGVDFEPVKYRHVPRLITENKYRAISEFIDKSGHDFDLIHCHSVYDLGIIGLKLRDKLGIPFVQTVYGTDLNWLFGVGGLWADETIAAATRVVVSQADALIGVSRDLGDKAVECGASRENVHWVPNGYDENYFNIKDKEANSAADRKTILFVGHLIKTKGIEELITAFARVAATGEYRDVILRLVGHGSAEDTDNLKAIIREHGIEKKVEILGQQTHFEVSALMKAADLFCLPSWREGWPTVISESLACGTPVVGTDIGGIREMINEDNGLLCAVQSPDDLAVKLATALHKDWNPAEISGTVAQLSYSRLSDKIDDIYSSVLGECK